MTTRKMPPLPPAEPDHQDDDFLAFWDRYKATKGRETVRILGVEVTVPTDMPLTYEDDFRERMGTLRVSTTDSSSQQALEEFRELLVPLFGEGTYEVWKERGLTGRMLQVLLAWAMRNAKGQPTTFEEAAEIVDEAEQLRAEGKAPAAPNRAARRASSRTRASAGTGASSKPTSRASTASRRKN